MFQLPVRLMPRPAENGPLHKCGEPSRISDFSTFGQNIHQTNCLSLIAAVPNGPTCLEQYPVLQLPCCAVSGPHRLYNIVLGMAPMLAGDLSIDLQDCSRRKRSLFEVNCMRARHAGFSANARLKLPMLKQCHHLNLPARQLSPFV